MPTAVHYDASIALHLTHRVRFTRDALCPSNDALLRCLADAVRPTAAAPGEASATSAPTESAETTRAPARVLAFLDAGLLEAQPDLPERLARYAAAHRGCMRLADAAQPVPGGERCKNDPAVIDRVLAAMAGAGLDRHSYVLVIGGGAVLDAVGFAAAIAHRGLRLVRMPSTTLSQGDAGVGVKTGVNRFNQKNYLGTFNVPWAVLNDETLLATLPQREWRAGFSETAKVALLKDAVLFERLERHADAVAQRDLDETVPLLRRTAELHVEHIASAGDPFELGSARPLDFGHWAAHKLETISRFTLGHGEAVAVGLALDVTYAECCELLAPTVAERVRQCLRRMGFALHHPAVRDVDTLLAGVEEFRAHLGGRLALPMIADVARPVQVHELDRAVLCRAIDRLEQQAIN